jgi:hypothetical protein
MEQDRYTIEYEDQELFEAKIRDSMSRSSSKNRVGGLLQNSNSVSSLGGSVPTHAAPLKVPSRVINALEKP